MIIVVLDHPQETVNIAHVVRAMMNFGFQDLRLVAPAEYDTWRIEGIAHRPASVLERVQLHDELSSALADCIHIAAFSARGRTAKGNVQRPRQAAAEVLAMAEQGPVALLFGREDKGLSNEALDQAHRQIVIPTSPAYPSMNLAHAVTLMLYELALARGFEEQQVKPPRRDAPPADRALLEQLYAEVERALDAMNFFRRRERELIMRSVRSMVHRVPLDQREARLIKSMAIEAAKALEGEEGRAT